MAAPIPDFRPRVNPMGGVSIQDMVAARTTPMTQVAQAIPAVIQALQQRRAMAERQQQLAAIAQGISQAGAMPQNMTRENYLQGIQGLGADQIQAGLMSGALDAATAYKLSALGQAGQRAELLKDFNATDPNRPQVVGVVDAQGNVRYVPAPAGAKVAGIRDTPEPKESAAEKAKGEIVGTMQGIKEAFGNKGQLESQTGSPQLTPQQKIDLERAKSLKPGGKIVINGQTFEKKSDGRLYPVEAKEK